MAKNSCQQKLSAARSFLFGDAIFHVRPAVVVPPNFFRWQGETGDEEAESVAADIEEFFFLARRAQRIIAHGSPRSDAGVASPVAVEKLTHRIVLVQSALLLDAYRLARQA